MADSIWRTYFLKINLYKQALEILQSIPEEQQNDYGRISQIKSRSNESLQEYEADIEQLNHLAYSQAPKEFVEQIGIQTFVDGLVDTEMQQALRLGRDTPLLSPKEESRHCYCGRIGHLGPNRELIHQTDNRSRDQDLGAQIKKNWREDKRTSTNSQQRNSRSPTPDRRSRSRSPARESENRGACRLLKFYAPRFLSQIKVVMQRENQDAHVREMSDQHLILASVINESVISRNKNRSICADVMDRLYSILRMRPAINC
ncbi:hypothetical protein NQ318_021952 [Aromia moschata]|uniref:Uncharacterized protein n=1 Tax=Aromia moschata TaxID=1265417 RepID=A0AAV8XVI1_9CUCU|nr:hypothetical protein NQ318_021952 [Aromia moschata]